MGRTNEYQTETSPFDGSQKDAEMAPEKKVFCDIFMDGVDSSGLIREPSQMIEKLKSVLTFGKAQQIENFLNRHELSFRLILIVAVVYLLLVHFKTCV